MISRVLLRRNNIMMMRQSQRLFASAAGSYESVSSENWYTPERKVDFTNKHSVIFDADRVTERKYTAWEFKELAITNGLGIFGVNLYGLIVDLNLVHSAGCAFFTFNYLYKTFNYANNSVTKVELLEGGTQARLTFGK